MKTNKNVFVGSIKTDVAIKFYVKNYPCRLIFKSARLKITTFGLTSNLCDSLQSCFALTLFLRLTPSYRVDLEKRGPGTSFMTYYLQVLVELEDAFII